MNLDKNTPSSIETWDKLAQLYQNKFMEFDLYNDTYDYFCSLLKINASVLEIGCGPGNITKYISEKRTDTTIYATDASANMIKAASENCLSATFGVLDCRNLASITKKYDGIIGGFCMPYLSKEECTALIKESAERLNKNGIVYFSTIEGDYKNSGYETSSNSEHKIFVYYYEEAFLMDALRQNELNEIKVFRKKYSRQNRAEQTHIVLVAKKSS
jgi:cyclopropane fatty-acyl-phospholipid synthase-like methyltransferase